MDESKAPTVNQRKQECIEWLEDYNECLHHEKEVSRLASSAIAPIKLDAITSSDICHRTSLLYPATLTYTTR
jgi:hypothetical protein